MKRPVYLLTIALALLGCRGDHPPRYLGTLEWDRITLPAERSEPIVQLAVREGDTVDTGQLLVELDTARQAAQLARAQADVAQAEAALTEARNGARVETIDAARAEQANAEAELAEATREYRRQSDLLVRGLTPVADRDAARTRMERAQAGLEEAQARLREVLAGTRPEQIDQAEARLAAAQAARDIARMDLDRLRIAAPASGVVDELPFEAGDQPPVGAAVISLLVGERPYARVYIPAPARAGMRVGDRFSVQVEGVTTPLTARLRHIRDEPSFTPYYALSGDDANRLVYLAELALEGGNDLPAGLPVTAEYLGHAQQ